jgi:hypothetical protein
MVAIVAGDTFSTIGYCEGLEWVLPVHQDTKSCVQNVMKLLRVLVSHCAGRTGQDSIFAIKGGAIN